MTTATRPARSVALLGLGAIGVEVARLLDRGVEGLRLAAVSDRDEARARSVLAGFRDPPRLVALAELAAHDIVVEAAGARALPVIAEAVIDAGKILVPCSVGALLAHPDLAARAAATGARIIVPSGALGALDAVRAAMEGTVASISIETRKPPRGLVGAPHIEASEIDLDAIATPTCVFEGNALEAARGFPANVNVAAALALAGLGPERTMVRVIADPELSRNVHTVRLESDAVRFSMRLEGIPSVDNPRTSSLTPYSVVAALRGLVAPMRIGS